MDIATLTAMVWTACYYLVSAAAALGLITLASRATNILTSQMISFSLKVFGFGSKSANIQPEFNLTLEEKKAVEAARLNRISPSTRPVLERREMNDDERAKLDKAHSALRDITKSQPIVITPPAVTSPNVVPTGNK